MGIFVRTITNKTIELDLEPTGTIKNIKAEIYNKQGIPYDLQLLSNNGKKLEDEISLTNSNIHEGSIVNLCLNLLGGAKKRKKKTYSKPKKKKHIHKNVKLRILSYYKLDSEKINRLRKECPECKVAGLRARFLATHKDRLHCGRCG